MKFLFALGLFIVATFQLKAQDTSKVYYDTAKTLIWYVANPATGASTTTYAMRITKSALQFIQPTATDLAKDSFSVKKQRVPIEVNYYIPIVGVDSAAIKKHKKLTQTDYITVFTPLPKELILSDFQKNFDDLFRKAQQITGAKQDSAKISPKKGK